MIEFPDYLPILGRIPSSTGLFIVTFPVNGISNTVGELYQNTQSQYIIRPIFYNGQGIRWNGESFENADLGSGWGDQVVQTANLPFRRTIHADVENWPTENDFIYRVVPAE